MFLLPFVSLVLACVVIRLHFTIFFINMKESKWRRDKFCYTNVVNTNEATSALINNRKIGHPAVECPCNYSYFFLACLRMSNATATTMMRPLTIY